MSDTGSRFPVSAPPTKYSHRAANALARFAQPFFSGSRPPSPQNNRDGPRPIRSKSLPGEPQTVTHQTGLPITTLDISPQRTHAVVGGKDLLKIIRVSPDHSSEEFNIRNALINYASTHQGAGVSMPHKDQLNVRDVKWSHGDYDRIIATAVANGRIVVYDLQRPGLQLCRFQGHNRQVHRLAFNPHRAAWLLSGSQDGTIRMWDLRTASANRGLSTCGSKQIYQGNSDAIRDVRWSPSDGVVFATASDSGAIQMWDSRKTNAPLMRIAAHDRPCFAVDWHPDGKHIVSGGTDRQVKVWDFSSAERRQKPAFHFRTPQPITNLRWRPPSWVGDSPASGEWQSSQIVTAYDKEDPRIHLWDLRRPYVPFREFDRYDSPAADLLWHSKDLLWTVGDAGAFTQTDVRYAPTVVNRRPTCSVAWSPNGELVAFAQKRPRRRPLGISASEFVNFEEDRASTGDKSLSHSPADDILDDVALTSSLRQPSTTSAAVRPSKSLGSTPPGGMDLISVLPLNQALEKISVPGPDQLGAIGSIPGATNDASLFRFLASNYSSLMDEHRRVHSHADVLNLLMESLDQNAERADDVSMTKLAQTWRIVKFAILQELQRRSREQPPGKGGPKGKSSQDGLLSSDRPRAVDETRQGKVKSRLFKGVMETEGQRSLIPETESTSNMTTPLAQPLPDSPMDSWSSESQIPSLDDNAVDLDPLPPSVLSSHNGWSMSGPDVPPVPASQPEQFASSEDTRPSGDSLPDHLRSSEQPDPDSDQRSAPRAIAGRADWRIRNRPDFPREGSEEDYDQKMDEKRAALSDFKQFPKKVLTLDPPVESNRPPATDRYQRHDSSESFPMFSASTDSSQPSKSIGASFSSNPRLPDTRLSETAGQAGSYSSGRPGAAARRGSNLHTAREEPEDVDDDLDESALEEDRVHLERPSSPPPLLTESTPMQHHASEDNPIPPSSPMFSTGTSAYPAAAGIYEDLSRVKIPLVPDATDLKPWSIEAIMREAIRYYHSSSSAVDIQTAAHLLHKLHVLFQDCEQILPYEECEMVLKTYNDHLIRHGMELEAAELRLSCVPAYPAVYDYAQSDTFINVFCYTCQRPYENPTRDNTRCHRCDTPQAACSICMSLEPPSEWIVAQQHKQSDSLDGSSSDLDADTISHLSSQSSVPTEPVPTSELDVLDPFTAPRPKGSALWTWCQGCGHGGHLACITTWLGDLSISEGGCATPGCSHDCGPGPRRQLNRQTLFAESKRRDSASRSAGVGLVKRDPWTKGESKAVEKVRGMLGAAGVAAATGGSGSGPNTSAAPTAPPSPGAASPKKVRLVTPVEQGRRRGASNRSSGGPRD